MYVAVQQMVGMMGGPIGASFIIHSSVCASSDHASLAQLISISFFMSGLCTVIQVTFGVRYIIIIYTLYDYIRYYYIITQFSAATQ